MIEKKGEKGEKGKNAKQKQEAYQERNTIEKEHKIKIEIIADVKKIESEILDPHQN